MATQPHVNQILQGLRKNVIINGNFDVWQRGTSFAASPTAYTADRFQFQKSGSTAVYTVSRDTDVPTYAESGVRSNYGIKLDCTTGDVVVGITDIISIKQKIEGYNYTQVAGGNATLSFGVKATKTGTYCVSFRNSGNDRSYVAEYTVNSSDEWERKSITVPLTETGGTWDYTTGIGLVIEWALHVGSTYQAAANTWHTGDYRATSNQVNAADNVANNFQLAQIQFERGDSPTELEYASYADELARCQRYFQDIEGIGMNGYCGATNKAYRMIGSLLGPMRVTPTSATLTGTMTIWDGLASQDVTTVNAWYLSNSTIQFDADVSGSSFTVGRPLQTLVGTGYSIEVDAEL